MPNVASRLDANRLASSAAIAGGIAYAVCAAAVALAPDLTLRLVGWLAHVLNVEQFASDVGVTPGAFLLGLLEVVVYAYLVTLLFAATYNRLGRAGERRASGRMRPVS